MKTITLTSLLKRSISTISIYILMVFSTLVYGLDPIPNNIFNSVSFQTENINLPEGSIIIDMGVVPQTINNGIKPYGLVHSLLKYYSTPVIWSINPLKVKDGIDFTVDGRNFRGGPFIISKEYLSNDIISVINTWKAKGVVTYTTQSSVSVPVYRELTFGVTWVLNEINDGIAKKYLQNAEIPVSDYYTSLPSGLTSCEDIFIIPHADPDWEGFGNPLLDWNESIANGGNSGWIWAGCQAVSNLEGDFDPTNTNIRTNFLAENPTIYPGEFDGYGLIDHGDHKDASGLTPYLNDFPTDPMMQFIGRTDKAHKGGSEQIYMPYPTGNWRSTTKVAVWDPNQENVLEGDSPGKAALIAYGRAFGDSSRGMVLYEGGHELKNGSEAENVAAQRVFFNFSFEAPAEKAPVILDNGSIPSLVVSGESIQFDVTSTATNNNIVSYEWSSTCPSGSFSDSSIRNPVFTAGFISTTQDCNVRVKVTDSCGRISFKSWLIRIMPYIPEPTPRSCDCSPFYDNSNFANPQLITGSALSVGSVYRFANVFPNNPYGTTVDALVKVEQFNGGASLLNIDVTSSGLQEAFQPRINSTNNNDQSVLFSITFVEGGGNYGDEVVISYFASPYDIDGDGANTREYAEISLPDAYFVSNNTVLNLTQTATLVRGQAINTTTAPGGDVSLDPKYTYSNYFENKSSLTYRIGKIGGNSDRYYSLDMDSANYLNPNSVLVTYPVICGQVKDIDNNPLAGVNVNITGSDGSAQSLTTDASGNYKATATIPEALVDVIYEIRENDPDGYISVSDVDGANDNLITRTINLMSTCGNDFIDGIEPTITIEDKTDILCNGESTGSITVNASGGVPPYQFSANGGAFQSSPVFSDLPAGNYTIELIDSLGNTASANVTLNEPANPLSVNITKENATTGQSCQNGEATATVGGGTAPYTYLWSASAGNQTTATATNLPDGTHTLTITDANGCVLEQGVVIDCSNTCDQIVSIDSVTDILCTGDNTGSTTVSASSGYDSTRTFTFTWNTTPPQVDSGVTSSTLTGLTAGIYTVSVTIDGTVCLPVEESVTIVEPANALNVSATATDESGPATGDGTATAIATGGTPPYIYSWSPGGQTTEEITGLSAGDYTVTVTDANGCAEVTTITVNPGSCMNLSVTASATSATCNGDSDGTATANVTGGSGSFTYLWNPGGATTQTITGLAAGAYVITITDTVTLCTVQATATINEPNELSSGIAISNVLCFGEETGSLDLTVSGGTFPYTFAWDNGVTTEDINNLAAGTYTVTITDVNGCVTTDTATVMQPNDGMALTTTVVDVLCTGDSTGSIDLTVTGGTPPYFYVWNNGESTEDISNLPAGSYNVIITDASGCQLNQNGIVVNEPVNPLSVNITKENATTDQGCQNGEATATVGGGTAPYTYLWSASAGDQTTETATNLPDGTHTVTITDANGCVLIQGVVIDCSNTCDQIVAIDSVTDVLCTGDNTGSTTVSASSGYDSSRTFTFTWNTTPPQVDSGVTSSTLTGLTTGIYTVSVTIDGTVCLPVEESVTIVEPANALNVSATATDESGPATGDGTATAIATGGTPPYTYSWSPGGQTTEEITGLSAGDYTVTVMDANGCTAVITTTVNPGSCQNLSVTATATSATCNGDSDGTATANITGGSGSFTYSWSPGGATTQTIMGLAAGAYVITITDTVTLCTVQATATINEPNELSSGIAISNVLCFGEETGSLDLTVSGGTFPYTFAWDNGVTTEDINNLAAGTYTVTITDVNGCVTTDTATVMQPNDGMALTTTVVDVLCTGDSTGSIDLTVTGGTPPYFYVWNNGESTEDISNLPAGSYNVIITDASGCQLNQNGIVVNEPVNPLSVNITKENATTDQGCQNGEATATVGGGTAPYTYLWSASAGDQTTETATNLPDGTHTVTITDANGCVLIQGVVIDCSNTCDQIVAIDSVTDVLCTGDNTGSTTVSASSGYDSSRTFTFTWNTTPPQVDSGVTSSTLTGLTTGIYTVSVTIDGTVCLPVEESVTIVEPANALNVSATATDESGPATGDGTATAIATGGTPPYTYSWSPGGQTTEEITGLSAGDYTVTVMDANGCTAVITTTVNPGSCQNLSVTATATSATCNGDSDGTATANITGGSGSFTYSWSPGGATTQTIMGLAAGAYVITITDTVTLCTVQATATINEPNELSSGIAISNVLCFGEETGSLDLTVSGGTFPYTFAWDNGVTTEDINNLAAGTYTVTITDVNGCVTTDTATVMQPNDGMALTTTVVDVLCTGDSTGSIDLTVTGGTPPYFYVWNNGESTEDISNLPAGSYNVIITDASGCQLNQNGIVVNEPVNPLSVNITKENATTDQGCQNGEATATVGGGTAPYTYLWSASAGDQTTETATNLPDGTHTVTITDANGCVLIQGVVIDCSNTCDQIVAIDSVTDVLCTGDNTGSTTVSASSGYDSSRTFTFTWNTTPPQVDSGVTSSTLTGLTTGIYTVSVTIDGTVCLPVEESVTIVEPANALNVSATATDESGPATGDGTATAIATGGTPPYTYSWSPGGQTTEEITGLSAGDYTVTVMDANGCTAVITTTVNPGSCQNLSVTATATSATCNGDSDGTATANITGGSGSFTYSWSPGGATTQTIMGLAAGAYVITITDTVTLCTVQATATINEPNELSSGIAISNVLCFGEETGSLDLTVSGGTFPYTFAWDNGVTTEDINNLAAGTYTVTITDVNGCVTTDTATIVQPSGSLIVDITSQTDIICDISLGSVLIDANGGTSPYLFNLDGGAVQNTGLFADLQAGTYTINIIDANGCNDSIAITILTNCTDAENDINNTFADTSVSGNVLTNDSDAEGDTQTVTTTTVTTAEGVVVTIDPNTGEYTYTPPTGYVGEDSFEYTVCDDGNPQACDTAAVYIEVLPIGGPDNEAPIANPDTAGTEQDTPVTGNVLSNDFDPDGDPIVVTTTTVTTAEGVVVTIDPNTGEYVYTPPAGFTGDDSFEYTICDNGNPALCDTAIVVITVTPDNGNTTIANDDAYNGTPGATVSGNVLDNDSDPEGDMQTVNTTPVEDVDNGTLVLNADGTFSYVPNDGFTGTDSFVYSVCDDGTPQVCDQATVYITVGGTGNTTDAENDINNTFVDTSVSGNVLTNDSDAEGDTQTVTTTTVTTAEGVVVTIDPNTGEYTYTPPTGYVGEDSFEYTVCDDGNPQACDTAAVYIEVLPIGGPDNEAPIANPDTAGTEQDTPVTGNVLSNDFDPDGDPIVVTTTTVTTAEGVVVTIDPNTGEYVYTPPAGFTGDDSFEYTICDNGNPALCDTAIVVITVTPDNGNTTIANDDAYNGTPGATVSGNVLDNDSDPEGDMQTVNTTPVEDVDNGTLVLNADGTFSYVPNDGFTGTDSFVYSVCDDGTPQVCDQATVYITVGGTGNTTDAENDINNTFVDTSVSGNVLTNDSDAEGDTQTVTTTTVTTAEGVVVTIDPNTGEYTYTPPTGYVGEDSFEYTVCDDGNPQACDTATVYIEVLPIGGPDNEAPIANPDTAGTEQDTPVTGNVLSNDFDPDGDPIVVTTTTVTTAEGVVVTIDPNTGEYVYTPPAGFTGDDSFEYTICDNGNPALCDTAIVVITVTPDNGNTTIANDDAYNGTPGATVSGNVLDNDSDPEGDMQTVNTTPVEDVDNGTLVLNADGTFSYVPNDGFTGTDSFVYSVCDDGTPQACDQATVYITVGGTGNTTDAENDINNTFVDTSVSGNVLTNDSDAEGDTQTVTTTTVTTAEGVVVTIDPNTGEYTYTPPTGYVGEDSFEYTVCDDGNPQACDTAAVYIEVLPIGGPDNEAPIANPDTAGTEQDTPVTGNVLSNDFDPDGDPIVVTTTTVTTAEGVVVTIDPNTGEYVYTPPAGFTGDDSFEYTICDNGNPALCDTAIVVITVTPDNGNTTIANDDAYNGTPGATVSGNVLDNDSDPEGDMQTVNTTPVEDVDNGTLVLNADGTFSYVPNDGFTGTDSFVYSVCDDGTPQVCDQATVYITVGGTGNTTDAENDINNTFVDTSVSGNVLTNDSDAEGDTQTVTTTTVTTAEGVVVTIDPNTGEYTYTPPTGYVGEDSFEYTVCDDGNPQACDTATVYIEVLPIGGPDNEAPIANPDTAGTEQDTPVTGNVLSNDFDPDGDPIVVTTTTVTTAEGVVVTIDPNTGEYVYTPPAGFTGDDSFEYTICDNGNPALCDTAIVVITVTLDDRNNITVANDDAYFNNTCDSVSGNVLDNDSDPEGDMQTVNTTPVDDVDNGTLVLNSDGTFSYVPNDGFTGTDSFVYSVCDDGTPQACDQATVYISISLSGLPEVIQGTSLCAVDETESQIFNLFNLLDGDDNENSGTWEVVSGDASIINDIEFDPTSIELIGENASVEVTFSYTLPNSSCSVEATIEIHNRCAVLACGDEDLVISKVITPNGDFYNEYFEVLGVEDCDYIIDLKIINRWGAIVFESNDYQNDWNGFVLNGSLGSANQVPSGTYYYIVSLKNSGLKPKSGPVYIGTK